MTEEKILLPPCGDDHWWAPIPNQMGCYECLLCLKTGYRDLAQGAICSYTDGGKALRGRMTSEERRDILRGVAMNHVAKRRSQEESWLQTFAEQTHRER